MTANFKPRFSRRQLLGWSVTVLILVATFAYSSGASADEFNTNTAGGTGGDQFNTNTATTCHQSARGPALRATYGAGPVNGQYTSTPVLGGAVTLK